MTIDVSIPKNTKAPRVMRRQGLWGNAISRELR